MSAVNANEKDKIMIPNFVQQVASVEEELLTASTNVANYWQDNNKDQFYNSYINEYESSLELFIKGGTNNYGMGLDELLTFLDQKEREMEMLGRM